MSQHYSDPTRESDPHALPDIETFYAPFAGRCGCCEALDMEGAGIDCCISDGPMEDVHGWYWWPCFPGCLPDSDPIGPFATEAEALEDARGDA